MLEQKIDELIVAIKENTAARLAEGGAAAKPAAKAGTKAETKPAAKKKPTLTAEQVRAKILEVKDKHGMDRAKEIIAETGADDLADLLKNYAEQYASAYAAAEAALEEDEEPAADDDGL